MSDGGCRISPAGICMLLAALCHACSCSGRAAGTARPTVRVWAQDPSSFRAALDTQASPTWRDTAPPQGPKSPIGGVPPVLVSWPRRHLASPTCAPFPLSPLFASHAHTHPPHPPPRLPARASGCAWRGRAITPVGGIGTLPAEKDHGDVLSAPHLELTAISVLVLTLHQALASRAVTA